jgi:hypothetical protein
MGVKIIYEIKTCQECPFLEQERYYSPDSFEAPSYDWYCKKSLHKRIRGYVEWHEENKIPIPEWCELRVISKEEPTVEPTKESINIFKPNKFNKNGTRH